MSERTDELAENGVVLFDELLQQRVNDIAAYQALKDQQPDPRDISPDAAHTRLGIEFATGQFRESSRQGEEIIEGTDNVGTPERLVATELFKFADKVTDPVMELRRRWGVVSDIRSVLRSGGIGVALKDQSITLFSGISEEALETDHYYGSFNTQGDQINLHFKKGLEVSSSGRIPDHYVTKAEETTIKLHETLRYSLTHFQSAEAWLKAQQNGTGNFVILSDSADAELPKEMSLSDIQRYLFRVAIKEHKPKIRITVPAPETTDFKDTLTNNIAATFAEIIAEPTEPHKTTVVIRGGRGSRSYMRSRVGEDKTTSYDVRDYTKQRLHTVLEAAGVTTQDVADATREAVKALYTKPTMAQVMESISAKRNVDDFLEAVLGA